MFLKCLKTVEAHCSRAQYNSLRQGSLLGAQLLSEMRLGSRMFTVPMRHGADAPDPEDLWEPSPGDQAWRPRVRQQTPHLLMRQAEVPHLTSTPFWIWWLEENWTNPDCGISYEKTALCSSDSQCNKKNKAIPMLRGHECQHRQSHGIYETKLLELMKLFYQGHRTQHKHTKANWISMCWQWLHGYQNEKYNTIYNCS